MSLIGHIAYIITLMIYGVMTSIYAMTPIEKTTSQKYKKMTIITFFLVLFTLWWKNWTFDIYAQGVNIVFFMASLQLISEGDKLQKNKQKNDQ